MVKPNILARFTDDTETVMLAYVGQIEDATLIYPSDPRYKIFYYILPEPWRQGMPTPEDPPAEPIDPTPEQTSEIEPDA